MAPRFAYSYRIYRIDIAVALIHPKPLIVLSREHACSVRGAVNIAAHRGFENVMFSPASMKSRTYPLLVAEFLRHREFRPVSEITAEVFPGEQYAARGLGSPYKLSGSYPWRSASVVRHARLFRKNFPENGNQIEVPGGGGSFRRFHKQAFAFPD